MTTTICETPGQRRTARAREVFAESFPDPESKSAYYRAVGQKGNAARLTLSGDQAAALASAYALLAKIFAPNSGELGGAA